MKNLFRSMMFVAAAAMTFASCSKDPVTDNQPAPEQKTLHFVSSEGTDGPADHKIDTRTHFGNQYSVKWDDATDQVGVYIHDTDLLGGSSNKVGTIERVGTVAHFTAQVEAFSANDLFCAYYPYATANSSSAASVEMTVPAQQEQVETGTFNGTSNPMVAVCHVFTEEEAAAGTIKRPVKFRQLGAVGEFAIHSTNAAYQGEVVRSLTFTNSTSELVAGTFTYDLTNIQETGETIPVDKSTILANEGSNSVTVSLNEENAAVFPVSADEAENTLYMTVLPGEYTGDFVVTTDKATYTFKGKTVDFLRAYVRRFSLDLNNAERETVKPGDQVSVIDLAAIIAGGANMGNPGSYQAPEWTTDGIVYKAANVMKNAKGTPTNFAAEQILLLKKTDAVIYNVTAKPIRNITVYVAAASSTATNVSLTVSAGNEMQPTTNQTQLSSQTPEIVSVTYTGTTGDVAKNFAKYTIDYSGDNYEFFQISASSAFAALHKVEIEYGEPGPGVKVTGEKAYALAAADVDLHSFEYTTANTTADAEMTQDTPSQEWLTVTKEAGAEANTGTVKFQAKSANTSAEARSATITLSVPEGNTVEVTVTQKAPAKQLTMSQLTPLTNGNSIIVSWPEVENAVKYAFYLADKDGNAIDGKSGETEALAATFADLTPETTYKVFVKAVGNVLDYTDSEYASAEVTIPAVEIPTIEGLVAFTKALNPANQASVSVSSYGGGTVTGYIAGNNANGNLPKMLSVVDNTGNPGSGIVLFNDTAYNDASKFPIGAKVSIDLSGATVKNYNSLYQLMSATVTVTEMTPAEMIVPEITLDQFNSNAYMGMRVTVKDVATQESDTWNSTTGVKTVTMKGTGADLIVRVQATASFRSVEYAPKTGNISGVVETYNDVAQLFPQSEEDVAAFNDTTPKIVSVDPVSLNFTADGGEQTITVALKNKGANLLSVNGLSETLSATVDNAANTVTVTAAANSAETAVEQTLQISLENGNTIDVPVKQAAAGTPSIILGKAYAHTFSAKTEWDKSPATWSSLEWEWVKAGKGTLQNFDGSKGQQWGSKSSPLESMTLTLPAATYATFSGSASDVAVNKIVVNTSGASGVNAKLSVTVGGVSLTPASSALTTNATDFTFTSDTPLTGDVVIKWDVTLRAIYIKSISINN